MISRQEPLQRLITRDPATGREMVVTRLESPESGVTIEGAFSLGWIGRLTPDQLDFVGVLLRNRGNAQKAAAELGMAYNTARNRLDDIVAALGGTPEDERPDRSDVLARIASGDITPEEGTRLLRGE
jgi:hypothetical protein